MLKSLWAKRSTPLIYLKHILSYWYKISQIMFYCLMVIELLNDILWYWYEYKLDEYMIWPNFIRTFLLIYCIFWHSVDPTFSNIFKSSHIILSWTISSLIVFKTIFELTMKKGKLYRVVNLPSFVIDPISLFRYRYVCTIAQQGKMISPCFYQTTADLKYHLKTFMESLMKSDIFFKRKHQIIH